MTALAIPLIILFTVLTVLLFAFGVRRLLAHKADRRVVTGLLHQVLITFLAAASGIMAVLLLGLHGGPVLTPRVSLYQFLGCCLLAVAAILALRVLVQVFRPARS